MAALSLLHSWDQSWPLVLAQALHCRALGSKTTGVHADAFRRGCLEERRRALGRERKKQHDKEAESLGKTEDVLASTVETSRLAGETVKTLEQVQSSF